MEKRYCYNCKYCVRFSSGKPTGECGHNFGSKVIDSPVAGLVVQRPSAIVRNKNFDCNLFEDIGKKRNNDAMLILHFGIVVIGLFCGSVAGQLIYALWFK